MIVRLDDARAVAEAAAARFVEAAWRAVDAHGRFVVVLSGGSTPRLLLSLLAAGPWRLRVPWSKCHFLFGDERAVPPDDERSNYRMARETLLGHVRIPPEQVHRIRAEMDDPAAAAADYEAELRALYPRQPGPRFDLLLLGVGTDGHTASLFPGTPALVETERWVVAQHVPALDSWRITLTLPALRSARSILFLITGEEKAGVVAEAFGGRPHAAPHPCERVVPVAGERTILVDAAAASLLPR